MRVLRISRAVLTAGLSALALLTTLPPASAVGPAPKPIQFPEEGPLVQRAQALWQATRAHVLADAKASLSDAEYQKRRTPIWSVWIRLQAASAGENDRVSKVIPDVLRLLNDTYGWTAETPAARTAIRDRKRASTPARVAEFDKRFAQLR